MIVRLWLIQAETLPAPLPAEGNSMWPLIGGVLGFAAILALSYMGLRYISRRNLLAARGRHMRVIDRMVVGRDSMILLVRVADRLLVTGVGKEGFRTLCELNAGELEAGDDGRPPAPQPRDKEDKTPAIQGFWGRFLHNIKVNIGMMPQGTPPSRPGPSSSADGQTPSFQDALERSQKVLEQSPLPDSELGTPRPARETALNSNEPEAPAVTSDYNEAIERMQAFGRMEIEAQRREEPTAVDNLAFLQAARAYAAQQKQEKPPGTQSAPGPPPDLREIFPAQKDNIENLSERVRKRTRRLSRRLEGGQGTG